MMFDENVDLTGSTGYVSFEMRKEEQPDTAIYSKLPNLKNAHLKNYSLVGNSVEFGIGRLMIRYKFAKDLLIGFDEVENASYYAYNLNPNKTDPFEMRTVLEDWCSLAGNWSENYKIGNKIAGQEADASVLKFNIKEEVKRWCMDDAGRMEHNGIQLKTKSEKEGVYYKILSNDNALFNNFTEITLK